MSKSDSSAVAIQVIERMFSLLDVLSEHAEAMTLKSLSGSCNLHPSTAHRILNDLAVGGFVVRQGAGMYKLGPRLMTLGELVKSRLDIQQVGAQSLKDWHAKTALPAALWVQQGQALSPAAMVYNKKKPAPHFHAQDQRDLYASTCGLMFLSATSPQELASYAQVTGLPQHAPEQKMDMERLTHRLSRIDLERVVADRPTDASPETELHVAVWNHQHQLAGVVSVLAPSHADLADLDSQVRHLGSTIAQALGYRPNINTH